MDFTCPRFVNRNVIRFERCAERLIQRHARIAEINQGCYLGRLCGDQVPLLLNHIKRRGRSASQFLLFGIQQLLLENPGLDGGAITSASLPHGHQCNWKHPLPPD